MLTARHIREVYTKYVLGFMIFYFFYEWIPNILGLIFPSNFFDNYKSQLPQEVFDQLPVVPFVFIVYYMLVSGALILGRVIYTMAALRNRSINYAYLGEGMSHYIKATILMILILFICSFGFSFFFLPGIFLYYIYSQSFYLLADDNKIGIFEALRTSRRMMRGNLFNLIKLDLTYIPLLTFAFLPIIFVNLIASQNISETASMILGLVSRIILYVAMANIYMGRVTFYELMKFRGFKNFKYEGESDFKESLESNGISGGSKK